ncbi:MAG: hypothetical protein WCY11_12050 [Novosphingobium sp.]
MGHALLNAGAACQALLHIGALKSASPEAESLRRANPNRKRRVRQQADKRKDPAAHWAGRVFFR